MRIALEALGISTDIIRGQYIRVRSIVDRLLASTSSPPALSFDDRMNLIVSVWSIIDQIDSMRQTLHMMQNIHLQPTEPFLAHAADAKDLRNQMDHLGTNIKRLVSKKKMHPTFGVLFFTWCKDADLSLAPDGNWHLAKRHVVVVSLSTDQLPSSHVTDDLFGTQIIYPIGDLRFMALGHEINLTRAVNAAHDLRMFLESEGEAQWIKSTDGTPAATSPLVPDVPVFVIESTFAEAINIGKPPVLDKLLPINKQTRRMRQRSK